MSRARNLSDHALGRGRLWNGLPLPVEIVRLFWSTDEFDTGINEDIPDPPTTFFDLVYDVDMREFCIITDHAWYEVSCEVAEAILDWLRAKGFKPKGMERLLKARPSKSTGTKPVPSPCERDESGNPIRPRIDTVRLRLHNIRAERNFKHRVANEEW